MAEASPRVLLVEDDAGDVELILRALRAQSIPVEVDVVRDGAEAVDYLCRSGAHAERDRGTDPALILLDLSLPKLDGLQVLERIKQDPAVRRIPVVVVAARFDEQTVSRAYDLCANSFISKTADPDGFAALVGKLAHYWLSVNLAPRLRGPAGGLMLVLGMNLGHWVRPLH